VPPVPRIFGSQLSNNFKNLPNYEEAFHEILKETLSTGAGGGAGMSGTQTDEQEFNFGAGIIKTTFDHFLMEKDLNSVQI
jgi:hypothetical protein